MPFYYSEFISISKFNITISINNKIYCSFSVLIFKPFIICCVIIKINNRKIIIGAFLFFNIIITAIISCIFISN